MKSTNTYTLGIFYAFIAALFWGISGTFVQFLVENKGINISWLVSVRLLASGAVLLAIALFQNQKGKTSQSHLFAIWKDRSSVVQLFIFSVFGMVMVQYSYFAAIQYSNAATATVIQYTAPVIIALYYAFLRRKVPPTQELLAIFMALLGIFFLVTHGNIRTLAISDKGLFWGIISALSLAFYTVYPLRLLQKWQPIVVIGWSMLMGGIGFSILKSPFAFEGVWDWTSASMILFIIFIATALAFSIFLISVQWLGATMASLIATSEPLAATLLTVLWLKIAFGWIDWMGSILIILAILMLTLKPRAT